MGKYVSSNSIFYKVTVLVVMKVQQKPSIFPYILQKKIKLTWQPHIFGIIFGF